MDNSGTICPKCGNNKLQQLLSTTNEWKYYCPSCNIRYNKEDEIYNG